MEIRFSALSGRARTTPMLLACAFILAACAGDLLDSNDATPSTERKYAEAGAPPTGAPRLPGEYPAERIIDSQLSVSAVSMPSYLRATYLKDFDTTVVRITDPGAFGFASQKYRHAYSTRQPWNADGTRLLLGSTQYPQPILDGKTFRFMGRKSVPADPIWSNIDPDKMFGVSGNRFVTYRPSTGVTSVLRSFPEYSRLSIGGGEGSISNDDRRVALFGINSEGTDVLVYDPQADRVISKKSFPGYSAPNADIDNVHISQDGKHVVIGFQIPSRAYFSYNSEDMSLRTQLTQNIRSHMDMCVDSNGEQVMVTMLNSGAYFAVRLADGRARELLSSAHVNWVGHVSCRNLERPGWAYISLYPHSSKPSAYLKEHVFALKLDGSGAVQMFTPAYRSVSPADRAYDRETQAVPNRDGTKILFASDWGNASSGAVVHGFVVGKNPLD